MTLTVRLEKLRFIVDELHIAQHLALEAADSAASRMLARHILVRTFDFIEHARTLRKPLREARFPIQTFHQLKETYAKEFEDCFIDARHRLGAHVQDLDLERRLTLWNDVEAVKADYFVEGAREIYDHLAELQEPGCAPFQTPPELGDPDVAAILLKWRTLAAANPGFEMASDALALTRANTVSAINTTPVHARAAQLALLRRWITAQSTMIRDLDGHPRIARILKSRLITDVVSFADCLFTRPVLAGAPQEMKGLDDLVREGGQSAAPIDDLRAALHLAAVLNPVREVRNKVGGHLDGDDGASLASLLATLDACPLETALSFYGRLEAAFAKTCRNVIYLSAYASDGHRLKNVLGLAGGGTAAYRADKPDAVLTFERPIFDEATYRDRLQAWMVGTSEDRQAAQDYFRQAFGAAPIARTIDREERVASMVRHHRIEITTAHDHLAEALWAASDEDSAGRLIALLASGVGGYPTALAEILLAYARGPSPRHQAALIDSLGKVAPWWHEPTKAFLHAAASGSDETAAFWARTALARMFLHDEGLARANRRPGLGDWALIEAPLVTSLSRRDRVVQRLIWLSLFCDPRVGVMVRQFQDEIAALSHNITTALEDLTDPAVWAVRAPMLAQLLHLADLAGVAVLLFTPSSPLDEVDLVHRMLWALCHGPAVPSQRDDALRHLAFCYERDGDRATACEIVAGLAARNPENIDSQLLTLELADPGDPAAVVKAAVLLRATYVLDAGARSRLDAVERSLAEAAAVVN